MKILAFVIVVALFVVLVSLVDTSLSAIANSDFSIPVSGIEKFLEVSGGK